MQIFLIIAAVAAVLFLLTIIIYWLNLDTKIVKLLEKPMKRYYDSRKRDRKI